MRLTTAVTGVIVANVLVTFLSVTAIRNQGRRSPHGRSHGGLPNTALAMLLNGNGTVDPEILRDYTPTTPVPGEVECHVEVRRIEYVGGRCIHLGARSIRACQAGGYLDPFSRDCGNRGGHGRGGLSRGGRRTPAGRRPDWGRPRTRREQMRRRIGRK